MLYFEGITLVNFDKHRMFFVVKSEIKATLIMKTGCAVTFYKGIVYKFGISKKAQ